MKNERPSTNATGKADARSPYERDPGAGLPDDERLNEPTTPPGIEDGTPPPGSTTGRTTRGEYATDPATGAGGYRDHTGTFTTDPVDDPDRIEPIDPQI